MIKQNKIYDIGFRSSGFIIGLYITRCNQVDVYNNAFYDWTGVSHGGIFGTYISGSDGSPCTNINIINNVFYDFEWTDYNSSISAGYMGSDYISDITWKNNIISYFHHGTTPIGYSNYGTPTNLTWDYNDVYDLGSLTVPSGTGNISDDPLYTDALNFDFHLDTGSPCIDAGDPLIFDPDSSRSDMGCYGGPDGDW